MNNVHIYMYISYSEIDHSWILKHYSLPASDSALNDFGKLFLESVIVLKDNVKYNQLHTTTPWHESSNSI